MGSIIFIPGFMQRGDAWGAVAERLGESYPSLCLDFRTHTFEERVAEIRAAWQPGDVAVGYSMGGRLALHAVLRDPATALAALVLVGASAGIDHEAERASRRLADEELAAWIEARPIADVVDRWECQPVFETQPAVVVSAQRPGRLSHEPAQLASLLRGAGQGAQPSLAGRLGELPCPLVAIAGELDERYADAALRMAAAAPRGIAALVPGAGHAPQLEAPEVTAALLEQLLDEHVG